MVTKALKLYSRFVNLELEALEVLCATLSRYSAFCTGGSGDVTPLPTSLLQLGAWNLLYPGHLSNGRGTRLEISLLYMLQCPV